MSSINIELYKKLYLIRCAEQVIIENYNDDEMKTPMHMSMGEEAIVVGVCQALSRADQVFGTYRSHALYIAKTGETDNFFAELYGRAAGAVKGKGGSMHLSAPEAGLMATSAVVASTIPLAVGAAYANKLKKNKKTAVAFFGDGACDEGVFWESLNIACLMKLSILFVCEDNGYAVHTPDWQRHGYKSVTDIVRQFNINVFSAETTDVGKIYRLTLRAFNSIRKTSLPSFIYLKYYRYLEHVGINEDFKAGYRLRKEFLKWYRRDPLKIERAKLAKAIGVEETKKIEKEIDRKITLSLKKALEAKFPDKRELYKDVFYEKS